MSPRPRRLCGLLAATRLDPATHPPPRDTPALLLEEAKQVVLFAGPNMIGNALFMMLGIVDVAVVGHMLPSDDLAAAVLGITCFNLVAFALQGFATALDTLAATAIGAGDRTLSVRWMRLTALVLAGLLIPASLLLSASGPIVEVLFKQSPTIAAKTGKFCILLIPGLWALTGFQTVQKLMNAQGDMWPAVIVTGLGNLVNLAGGIMLIKHTNLGLSGSPIATTISRFAMCGALYCFYEFRALQLKRRGDEPRSELGREQYVTVASHTDSVLSEICPAGGGDVALEAALPGASSAAGKVDVEGGDGETAAAPASAPTAPPPRSLPSGTKLVERSFFGDIATIFKLGLPGGIMLALEAGAFEITTIFAAQISPIAISAHAIMMQVSGFIYMTFAVSTMIAASVRVGNALGRGIAPAASPSASETAFDDASEEEKVVAIAALEASREEKVASAAYDARRSAKVSIAFGALVMGLAGGILLVSREQLGAIFVKQGAVDTARGGSAASDKVSSDAIRALVAKLAPYAAAFAAADGVQGVAQGVLRGCGMQRTIAIANFCGFWVIGVPTGFYLCFTKSLGVQVPPFLPGHMTIIGILLAVSMFPSVLVLFQFLPPSLGTYMTIIQQMKSYIYKKNN